MHYGHPAHTNQPTDLTILYCGCGWHSDELTITQMHDLGIPWYCGFCDNKNVRWVRFDPSERAAARRAAGLKDGE